MTDTHPAQGSDERLAPRRILVVTDIVTATQVISFLNPLAPDCQTGATSLALATEGKSGSDLVTAFEDMQPDVVIFSRSTKPSALELSEIARAARVPCVYHIDDDLLKVPPSIGGGKAEAYSDESRRSRLRQLILNADVLYTSTAPLAEEMSEFRGKLEIISGDVYCTAVADALPMPRPSPWPVIGYMGSSSHVNDLALAVPAIERLLQENEILRFETFGGIEMPESLLRFGSRVQSHAGERNYASFIRKLQSLGWWIGLAPLENTAFNCCKADTKWVEYTSAGIAVIASDVAVYERACRKGSGCLARSVDDWYSMTSQLLASEADRQKMLERARLKLRKLYSPERVAQQIYNVVDRARSIVDARP